MAADSPGQFVLSCLKNCYFVNIISHKNEFGLGKIYNDLNLKIFRLSDAKSFNKTL